MASENEIQLLTGARPNRPMLELIHSMLPEKDRRTHAAGLIQNQTDRRQNRRIECQTEFFWDYFSLHEGTKKGRMLDISSCGALVLTEQPVELRRWIRIALPASGLPASENKESHPLYFTLSARVVRRTPPDQFGRWKLGLQFVQPLPELLQQRLQ